MREMARPKTAYVLTRGEYDKRGEAAERRQACALARACFLPVESLRVAGQKRAHDGMIGLPGLQQSAPGFFTPAGAAGHLLQQLDSHARVQQSLQRVAILSNEKFRGVRWTLTENQLRIACTNTEQEEAFEEIDIDYKGEALDIGFNARYLLDITAQLDSDTALFKLADPGSPTVIQDRDGAAALYVLMPMRV